MRVLQLSDGGLPDWRIEKYGMTSLKHGNEAIFAGTKPVNYTTKAFSKLYEINWSLLSRFGLPYYWHCVKKQVGKVIRDARPDIVHAHNIVSAKMMSEFDIPFVYDDHEYWPIHVRREIESIKSANYAPEHLGGKRGKLKKKVYVDVLLRRAARLWTRWEQEIVSTHPTITVSSAIAEELKSVYGCHHAFVVSNFPMASETADIKSPEFHGALSSVYAGIETQTKGYTPAHRNLDGLIDIFNAHDIGNLIMIGTRGESSLKVRYTGILSRKDMYNEMFNQSIGLLPMRKHWSHKFISPNKAYEYAHGGLFLLSMSSFTSVLDIFKENCMVFDDYQDLVSKLEYFRDNLDELYGKRLASYNFAKESLIWERDESKILEAYQLC